MAARLSPDLRKRVIEARREGLTWREIAENFRICFGSIARILKEWLSPETIKPRKKPGQKSKLEEHNAFILQKLQEKNDMTLEELRTCLIENRKVERVGIGTLHNHLVKLRQTFKKNHISQRTKASRHRAATRKMDKIISKIGEKN